MYRIIEGCYTFVAQADTRAEARDLADKWYAENPEADDDSLSMTNGRVFVGRLPRARVRKDHNIQTVGE